MRVDVCVIGAGPAGLAAAAMLGHYGRRVVVVDESPEPGGRLLGQLHRIGRRTDEYHQDGWWNGRRVAAGLLDAVPASVSFLQSSSVWGIYPGCGWRIGVTGDSPRLIDASHLLIATGAAELPVPIHDWTLPGVMTIGAGQVLATQYRVRPGRAGIVVGINPLSLAIAHELRMAGVAIRAIVNLPPGPLTPAGSAPAEVIAELARSAHLASTLPLRLAGRLGTHPAIAGLTARLQPPGGLRVWDIPVNPRRAVTSILGVGRAEGVRLADLSATGGIERTSELEVDTVFLAGGLRPLAELPALAGCRMLSVPEVGGTIPLYGPGLETTAPNVFVAGNVTGIESAIVAIAQGRLAAAAIVAPERIPELRQAVARARRDSPLDFQPHGRRGRQAIARTWRAAGHGDGAIAQAPVSPPAPPVADPFATVTDDLVVCRCEQVRLGAVRRQIAAGATTAEEIKRFTRMTMGACQGRVCQAILERIQLAATGQAAGPAPLPGHRPPIRPVPLAELAALADGTEEHERLHGSLLPSLPFDDPAGHRVADPRR